MRILAGAQPGPRLTPPSTRFSTIVGRSYTIALKYSRGKPTRTGNVMYTLTSGVVAFFPPHVAAAIDSLTLAPGQPLTVCHLGGDAWDVERAPLAPTHLSEPPRALPPAATRMEPPNDWQTHDSNPAPPAAAQAKVNGAGQTAAAILAGLYPAAIQVALAGVALAREKGLMVAPTFEDLRCIATTLFIQQTGGRG